MPKKRRQAHIPQQPTRRRRTVRRPDFATTTPAEERTDLDGEPIFADEVASSAATAHYGTAGPVETRAHWIGSTAQQRTPGRRTAQLRRGATFEAGPRMAAGQLPTFERAFLVDELKRIGIIAGSLFGLIIVLAIVMR